MKNEHKKNENLNMLTQQWKREGMKKLVKKQRHLPPYFNTRNSARRPPGTRCHAHCKRNLIIIDG